MKCNRCDYPQELKWDHTYHENYGKWRLLTPNDQVHECRIVSTGGFLCGYCLETFGINFVLYEKHRCVFRN